MITGMIFVLMILMVLFWIGFKLTGALLMAMFWLFIELPLGVMIGALGILFCCTLILIPIGIPLVKSGVRLMIPGV